MGATNIANNPIQLKLNWFYFHSDCAAVDGMTVKVLLIPGVGMLEALAATEVMKVKQVPVREFKQVFSVGVKVTMVSQGLSTEILNLTPSTDIDMMLV